MTTPDYSFIPDDRKRQLDALGKAGAALGIFDSDTMLDLGEFFATTPEPTQDELDAAMSSLSRG